MTYKKFENGDLFFNTIKAKTRFEFKIWGGKAVVNNGSGLAILNDLQTTPPILGGCPNPNSFDFSCEDNSHNLGII